MKNSLTICKRGLRISLSKFILRVVVKLLKSKKKILNIHIKKKKNKYNRYKSPECFVNNSSSNTFLNRLIYNGNKIKTTFDKIYKT